MCTTRRTVIATRISYVTRFRLVHFYGKGFKFRAWVSSNHTEIPLIWLRHTSRCPDVELYSFPLPRDSNWSTYAFFSWKFHPQNVSRLTLDWCRDTPLTDLFKTDSAWKSGREVGDDEQLSAIMAEERWRGWEAREVFVSCTEAITENGPQNYSLTLALDGEWTTECGNAFLFVSVFV